MCITWEIAVHAAVSEVTANVIVVAVDDGVSILIIYFSVTFLLSGSFGFRRCGLSTLFLMLNFCVVDFSIIYSTLDLRSLYYEALSTGCSCTAHIFEISCCCAADYLISFRISLADSSLSPTDPVV